MGDKSKTRTQKINKNKKIKRSTGWSAGEANGLPDSIGGGGTWNSHFGEQFARVLEDRNGHMHQPGSSTPGFTVERAKSDGGGHLQQQITVSLTCP